MPFAAPEGGQRAGGLPMRFLNGNDLNSFEERSLLRQKGMRWETARRYESNRGTRVVPRMDTPKADLSEERPEMGEGLER